MEEENKYYTIILRHDTSTQWTINDPILALGEYGVEDDTHRIKEEMELLLGQNYYMKQWD